MSCAAAVLVEVKVAKQSDEALRRIFRFGQLLLWTATSLLGQVITTVEHQSHYSITDKIALLLPLSLTMASAW